MSDAARSESASNGSSAGPVAANRSAANRSAAGHRTTTRMLATDLDGTLLRSDLTVSPRALAALGKAREAGLIVTVVTGRPPRWLAPVIDQLGWQGLAVSANGAVLVDLTNRIVEHTSPIDAQAALETVARIREAIPGAGFGVERIPVGARIPESPIAAHQERAGELPQYGHDAAYRPKLIPPGNLPTVPVEELISRGDIVKLLARGPEGHALDPDQMLTHLQDQLSGVVTVTHSTKGDLLLEMSAHDTSKASGLAWLASAHGVDSANVTAVGDMPNDLPMLQWAGHGWAVANAHSAVLNSVGPQRVTGANDDDGVAALIEQILLELP